MLCLWLHIIICLVQYQIGFSYLANNTSKNHLCHQEESQLLLQLRELVPHPEELEFHSMCYDIQRSNSTLMYWDKRRDCCLWDGVTCDKSSGHVVGLDLSCSALTGKLHSNSTLFRLTHLRNLNLAYNDFEGSEISFKFGQLNSLTDLNLSRSGFDGPLPVEFYHLFNLVSLDITSDLHSTEEVTDHFYTQLQCDIKTLFGNMTKLRAVFLGGVNISSELPINMSSFLTHLDLGDTGVQGNLPVSIFEKPNLQYLNLGGNDGLTGSLPSFNRSNVRLIEQLLIWRTGVSGRLPDSVGFMTRLKRVNLSECIFTGPIPDSIGNLTEITEMDLSSNDFSGEVPSTISSLRQLTILYLSNNHLKGQLPDALSDLQKLTALNVSSNALAGQIPSSFTNMSQLQSMDISSNKLTGHLPSSAGDGLQNLSGIYFSNNLFQGMIPSWLLSLPSLLNLDLSSNMFTGFGKFNSESLLGLDLSNNQLNIEIDSFYNLSQIQFLSLSHNTVTEQSHEVVNVSLPDLGTLDLSSCEVKEFPHLLRNLSGLSYLGLSNNQIHGPIPSWFGSLPLLSYLNLSVNFLTSAPWQNLSYLKTLDLHSNSLQDTFPSSICDMSDLRVLDLSSNKLRGTIPQCIGTFSHELEVLDLRRNELHGKIPTTVGGMDGAM